MIHLVKSRTSTYNNSPGIATNPMLSALKLLYYRLIALLYAACGKCSQLTIVNGSWTAGHISTLWGCDPQKVYPPCDIDTLVALEQKGEEILEQRKQILILSVGQIRPEKDHPKQIQIFAELKRQLEERGSQIKAKLVFAGGCRNEVDRNRVGSLKSYALNNFQLDSADEIVDEEQQDLIWRLNIPFKELTTLLQESFIGLHTMWNEHFGISVVEKMAAGLLMVAHNSGGPKLDIIGDSDLTENEIVLTSGFLADTKEEYVTKILTILLDMGRSERDQIRANAREKVKRFSDGRFEEQFCDVVEPMVRGRRTQSIKSEEEKE